MMRDDKTAPLRIGIIGAGFISQITHLPCYTSSSGASVAAISDPRPQLLESVADHFQVVKRYRHHDHLLDDLDAARLDAVVICVHRRCLAPLVFRALASKRAVFSEKPMAYTLAQAERLVAAVSNGQAYAVGYMKRFDPGVRKFQKLLVEETTKKRFGSLIHVLVRDFCPTYAAPIPHHFHTGEQEAYRYEEWPSIPDHLSREKQDDYDFTLNVLSHDLNLIRWLFAIEPTPHALIVRSHRAQTAVLDAGTFDVTIEAGRSNSGAWDQSIEVFFEHGRMRLRLASPLLQQEVASIEIEKAGSIDRISPALNERTWPFLAQAQQFIAAAKGEVSLESSGADSLNDLALVEALWRRAIWQQ